MANLASELRKEENKCADLFSPNRPKYTGRKKKREVRNRERLERVSGKKVS